MMIVQTYQSWASTTYQIYQGVGGDKKTSQGSSSRNKDLQAKIGESSDLERCCI